MRVSMSAQVRTAPPPPPIHHMIGSQWVQIPRHGDPITASPAAAAPEISVSRIRPARV
jgi:hypothetical protein